MTEDILVSKFVERLLARRTEVVKRMEDLNEELEEIEMFFTVAERFGVVNTKEEKP